MNAEDRCFCELAPLYALNLLDDDDRRWVEAQTIVNPELAAELADYQTTVNVLPYSAAPEPIPAALKDRLFQRIAQEPMGDLAVSLPPDNSLVASIAAPTEVPLPIAFNQEVRRSQTVPIRRRNVVWLQAAGTIAAIAAIALLVDNYLLRQKIQADQAVVATFQQPDSVVYTLKGTDKAANASGSLVVNAGEKTAVALVQNLPTLPAGQAYRLWAMPKGATKPTYCGQFNNNRSGTVRWSLPAAVCSASAPQMLITAESASAPFVPQGTLVMQSVL